MALHQLVEEEVGQGVEELQMEEEGVLFPLEVEEAGLLVKEAEGVDVPHGMEVGVVGHLLSLLVVVVGHPVRGEVAVGVLLIDLWMELEALKTKYNSKISKFKLPLMNILIHPRGQIYEIEHRKVNN